MSFRQVYVRKEVWPKVILKRLSVSLTHPYKCTRCKEQFHKIHEATTHYLSSHQNSNDLPEKEIHENETKFEVRQHKCMGYEPCSAKFKKESYLRRHIASVHEKIKPYKCPTCGSNFSLKHHMRIHIAAVHERKKLYSCNTCDASFGHKSNLNGHITSVHEGKKTYDCKICDAQFVAKQVLQKHISKVHEGKRPYACKICDTNYATKQGLQVHISRVHAGTLPSN